MRSTPRPIFFFALAALLLAGAPLHARPTTQRPPTPKEAAETWIAYGNLLAKGCPDAKVPYLQPVQLDTRIVVFESLMTPDQRERAVEMQRRACSDATAGAACSNVGFLYQARQEKYLPGFVNTLCHSGVRCTAEGVCNVPTPPAPSH